MKSKIYLVVSIDGIIKTTKKAPSLLGNERAIELSVEVPDEIFTASYIMSKLVVTEDDIINPTAEIMAQQALNQL